VRSGKQIKTKKDLTFQDVLEKSRHEKLWLRANYAASAIIIGFFLVATLNIIADIRGEYHSYIHRVGQVRLSIRHSDGKLHGDLTLPPMKTVVVDVSDKEVGQDVDWQFKDPENPDKQTDVSFKGKVEPGTLTGVVQNGNAAYPVTLERDLIASILRQIRGLVPGASD